MKKAEVSLKLFKIIKMQSKDSKEVARAFLDLREALPRILTAYRVAPSQLTQIRNVTIRDSQSSGVAPMSQMVNRAVRNC